LNVELPAFGPGPTVIFTTLGPPAEKLLPLLLEELLPLLLEELLVLLPLLDELLLLLPGALERELPPPPQAVKAATASSVVQRRHRSMQNSRPIWKNRTTLFQFGHGHACWDQARDIGFALKRAQQCHRMHDEIGLRNAHLTVHAWPGLRGRGALKWLEVTPEQLSQIGRPRALPRDREHLAGVR
jgi:hypothetical protein